MNNQIKSTGLNITLNEDGSYDVGNEKVSLAINLSLDKAVKTLVEEELFDFATRDIEPTLLIYKVGNTEASVFNDGIEATKNYLHGVLALSKSANIDVSNICVKQEVFDIDSDKFVFMDAPYLDGLLADHLIGEINDAISINKSEKA